MNKREIILVSIGCLVIGFILFNALRSARGLAAINPELYNDNPKLKAFAEQFKATDMLAITNPYYATSSYFDGLDKIKDSRVIDIMLKGLDEKKLTINTKFFKAIFTQNRSSSNTEGISMLIDLASNFRITVINALIQPTHLQMMTKKQKEELYSKLVNILKTDVSFVPRRNAATALGSFGRYLGDKRAFSPLLEAFKNDKNIYVRGSAACGLGALGDKKRVFPILIKALKTEKKLQNDIILALGELGDKRATLPLISLLKTASKSMTRIRIIMSLGRLKDSRAIPVLSNELKNGYTKYIRNQAAMALGMLHTSAAITALSSSLKDDLDKDVRSEVALALSYTNNKLAVKPLINALNDSEKSVRQSAKHALRMLEVHGIKIPDDIKAKIKK